MYTNSWTWQFLVLHIGGFYHEHDKIIIILFLFSFEHGKFMLHIGVDLFVFTSGPFSLFVEGQKQWHFNAICLSLINLFFVQAGAPGAQ